MRRVTEQREHQSSLLPPRTQDLQGQRLADRINQELIVFGAVSFLRVARRSIHDTLTDRLTTQIVSLILGFVFESMAVMMSAFGAFSLLAFLVSTSPAHLTGYTHALTLAPTPTHSQLVVPPWPFYNRYETRWLPNIPAVAAGGDSKSGKAE